MNHALFNLSSSAKFGDFNLIRNPQSQIKREFKIIPTAIGICKQYMLRGDPEK